MITYSGSDSETPIDCNESGLERWVARVGGAPPEHDFVVKLLGFTIYG